MLMWNMKGWSLEETYTTVYGFVEIVKMGLKLRFYAILFDLINFQVFKIILQVMYILTRKIIRFYKLICNFNNTE